MKATIEARRRDWFEVLRTGARSQTVVMTLASGKSSGEKAEAHETRDQVLLILKGELIGEVAINV